MTNPNAVGRVTHLLIDASRNDRSFAVEVWYPLEEPTGEPAMYELLPGIGFFGAAVAGGAAAHGPLSVVIVSHGHTGTRLVYSQLCESMAQRGYVVVALDHPGDTMADVLLGAGVDEATNIEQRVGDLTFLYESLVGEQAGFDHGLEIDASRIHALGHSFGAYAVLEWSARGGANGTLASLVAFQPYLLPMTPSSLSRLATPLLIVAGECDATTPVATNVVPALSSIPAGIATTLVLEGVGHQGCSDVGLYVETAPTLPGIPDFVVDFLGTMAADTTGVAGEPWRPVTAAHAEIVASWLDHPGHAGVTDVAARHRGRVL